jgi:hypothetical protein
MRKIKSCNLSLGFLQIAAGINVGTKGLRHAAKSIFYFPQHAIYFITLSFSVQIIFTFYIKGAQKCKYASHRIKVNFVSTSIKSFCW